MTKREVASAATDLDLPAAGVLDLGAGTGSVGSALRLQPQLQLMAVEGRGGGGRLISQCPAPGGSRRRCSREMRSRPGAAARPDRVLLGGAAVNAALLQAVIARMKPGGVVVIPMATLEAVAELRPLSEAGWMCAATTSELARDAPGGGDAVVR